MAADAVAGSRQTTAVGALARKEALWFYVLISPWIAGFILFSGGPTIASAYLSLTHNDPVNWPPTWVGLLNYDVMFRDRLFWKSLQVTTYYTVLSVPLSVGFATFLALILNEKLPGMAAWRTIYYLPSIVTGVPVALMWNWIFQPQFGLVNGLLYDLGVPSSMLPKWLSDPQWAVPTFVIMSLWQFGGPMLIYLASIQGVPTQLYESAQLDGASKFRQIWHITLPSISPVIFFNGILAIISSFQVFTNAFVITQGGPNYATYFSDGSLVLPRGAGQMWTSGAPHSPLWCSRCYGRPKCSEQMHCLSDSALISV